MQYNRDPPPYPGHLKQQQLYQPGFRQSYSGSETSTDVSMSSTENLSLQARQDPQGEETNQLSHQLEYVELDSNSILARLGMPAVEVKSTNSGTFYVTGSMQQPNVMKSYVLNNQQNSPTPVRPHQFQDAPSLCASQKLAHLYKCVEKNQSQLQNQNQNLVQPNYHNEQPLVTNGYNNCTVAGYSSCITSAPDFSYLPPPPEYPGHKQLTVEQVERLRRSYELLNGEKSQNSSTSSTRSQPDLTRVTEGQAIKLVNIGQCEEDTSFDDKDSQLSKGTFTSTSTTSTINRKPSSDIDHALVAARASQLVERLSEENKALREELDGYYKKVTKLQKFELEIQKVHESHESLVRSSQKRESLETTMRLKLENECKKLKEVNKDLKDQLEKALSQPLTCNGTGSLKDSDLRKEVSKKDAIITKLIAQNKELVSGKERLEIELSAQRSTLQEQRTHIDVLDNALTNAQANVVRLEDECRKKDMYVERVEHLQKSLASLQRVCGNREQLQEKLTTKLQHEIHTLRAQNKSKSGELPKEEKSEDAEPTMEDMRQLLSEKEERILTLESDAIVWEQRYLEENALRQLAFDAASQPSDTDIYREARIAALEQNSAESERLIAEARTEKMKHIEEVYQAQRKSAEMETRLKSLQAQLAEKEAMIRVLQKHSFSSSNSSITMFNTPLHSPRPSYTMPINTSTMLSSHGSHSHNDVTTTSRDAASLASHSKSNSAGEVEKRNFRPSHPIDNVSLQQLLFEKKFDADKVSTCLWQV